MKQINHSNDRASLAEIELLTESKELLNGIRHANIYVINGGENLINSRKFGDISNSNFGPNSNFQGDGVTQTNIEQTTVLQTALDDLKVEIESISDEDNKDDASMYFEMLVKYIKESKPTRVEKCLTSLKGIVGTTASILTIASQLGISL